MPESPGLYLRLSVQENLECFAGLYESPAPRERIGDALRAVNLADRAGDLCGALSKGLRQRVALARALLGDPEVLFLATGWPSSNTTLRQIGRPDELRDRLFAKTLVARTVEPLIDPDRVFAGLPAVDGWRLDGDRTYVVASRMSRPPRQRSRARSWTRAPTCCPSASRATRCRTCTWN